MTLRLYNTLSRSIEPFEPVAPPRVTLYSCGPTVWNYAHIGNFRTFLFVDLLRRWLEASGYDVYHIMNLTDVDDRIIREAGAAGTTIGNLVQPFIAAFYEDRDYLRIRPAHEYPRATEFIEAMIRLVEGLLANGTAYRGEDGSVYFSIGRFPAYGRLSRLDTREIKTGASGRVSTDEYDKENARDFVLWKAARPEDEAASAAWDAPLGRGRPGWHLECSAMALELIGRRAGARVLDLHTGGVDRSSRTMKTRSRRAAPIPARRISPGTGSTAPSCRSRARRCPSASATPSRPGASGRGWWIRPPYGCSFSRHTTGRSSISRKTR
jgi:cysteinyl-tRNA synthetase